jgi:hypothetical protein
MGPSGCSESSCTVPLKCTVLLSTPRSFKCSLSFTFSTKAVYTSHQPHACYMRRPSHSPWFIHPNSKWWRVEIIKFMSCNFLHLYLTSYFLVYDVSLPWWWGQRRSLKRWILMNWHGCQPEKNLLSYCLGLNIIFGSLFWNTLSAFFRYDETPSFTLTHNRQTVFFSDGRPEKIFWTKC